MATIEVSTWAQLRSAIINAASGDTVKLIADIDCNTEIPEGVTATIRKGPTLNLTITGAYTEDGVTKNHVIRNLRTNISSPVSIFYFMYNYGDGSYVNFRNIDFINLILDAPLVELYYYLGAYLRFYSCRFVGKRTHALVYHNHKPTSSSDSAYIQFYSCFINMEYTRSSNDRLPIFLYQSGSSYDYGYANYCRIKQEYKGWTVGTNFAPSVATSPQNITHTLRLNGCYLYGTFVGGSAQQMGITDYYNYNSSLQNVVDADFRMVGDTSAAGTSMSMVMPKGIFVSRVRRWGDDSIEYTVNNYNSSGNAKAIPIPPEEMDDPAYLYAHGFDIVVPE